MYMYSSRHRRLCTAAPEFGIAVSIDRKNVQHFKECRKHTADVVLLLSACFLLTPQTHSTCHTSFSSKFHCCCVSTLQICWSLYLNLRM